ncbi:serpin-like protein [Deerpox virus W-848-83]|uniref:Serpin-like protein n=1 Tax=Deerpox virus (strain Mule deer/United States/W-848-83/1983) TaxID=305674 RepID=Q08FY2_DPV83|nr:Serpin-like protein [Deerpox virus W-848-83]ABI99175.1 serpin-like protein [Deerpox virus W-848-83]
MKKKYLFIFFILYLLQKNIYCQKNVSVINFGITGFKYSDDDKNNIVFSPYSLTMAMSMMQIATHGNSKMEIVTAMGMEVKKPFIEKMLIIDSINMANEVFVERNMVIYKKFMKRFKNIFNNTIKQVFFKNTKQATYIINDYIQKKTNNTIKDVIKKDTITEDLKMLLINAIYFNGNWKNIFPKQNTFDMQFYKEGGSIKMVKMMAQTNVFNVGTFDIPGYPAIKYDVIELPYKDESISMFVIVPQDKNMAIHHISNSLHYNLIDFWKKNMKEDFCQIYLPRFSIESNIDLKDVLSKMGIKNIFDKDLADFTTMTKEEIYVSKALQKTKIDVDETGTTAQSSTVILAIPRRVIKSIICNRPFMFLIEHKPTKMILFSGIVRDP